MSEFLSAGGYDSFSLQCRCCGQGDPYRFGIALNTVFVGFCPLNSLLGINSYKQKP